MNAELIAVGTELLLGQIENTHARFLSSDLATLGVSVYFHSVVGDNKERVAQAIELAAKRSDIVIVTGGLGPTDDDLTRDAAAQVFGLPMAFSDEAFSLHVAPFFSKLGKAISENNRKQAMRIGNAEFLPNPRGTAPGQYLLVNGRHIFLLPGPPLEMRPMYQEQVRPRLISLAGRSLIYSRVIHLFGIGESDVEMRIKYLMDSQSNPTLAPLASEGEMVLRLTAQAPSQDEAQALIRPLEDELMALLGEYVYGYDDDSLPSVVLRELTAQAMCVAFAESCTGGMLTSMVVDVPGSSRSVKGAVVSYDNSVKISALGVSQDTLLADGAVSEAVAIQMAEGVRQRLNANFGVSVTGIAGPDGGTKEKPVGTTFIAVASDRMTVAIHRKFAGDRAQIRIRAAKAALHLLLQVVRDRPKA